MVRFVTTLSENCWNSAKGIQINLMSWYVAHCAVLLRNVVMPQWVYIFWQWLYEPYTSKKNVFCLVKILYTYHRIPNFCLTLDSDFESIENLLWIIFNILLSSSISIFFPDLQAQNMKCVNSCSPWIGRTDFPAFAGVPVAIMSRC